MVLDEATALVRLRRYLTSSYSYLPTQWQSYTRDMPSYLVLRPIASTPRWLLASWLSYHTSGSTKSKKGIHFFSFAPRLRFRSLIPLSWITRVIRTVDLITKCSISSIWCWIKLSLHSSSLSTRIYGRTRFSQDLGLTGLEQPWDASFDKIDAHELGAFTGLQLSIPGELSSRRSLQSASPTSSTEQCRFQWHVIILLRLPDLSSKLLEDSQSESLLCRRFQIQGSLHAFSTRSFHSISQI